MRFKKRSKKERKKTFGHCARCPKILAEYLATMLLELCLGLWALMEVVQGHGSMIDPPARNVMWRFGFNNPVNFDFDENFCGGVTRQWNINNGSCGVCGDAFDEPEPRTHEVGGIYANGIVVRSYKPGQVINVVVQLSTNHHGYYEFRLCPTGDPNKEVTQECLNKHLLKQVPSGETRWPIPCLTEQCGRNYSTQVRLKLPEGLTCNHCVLQWHWTTGNFWGTCENGTEMLGCGQQETYQNCADITIADEQVGTPHYYHRYHSYWNYVDNLGKNYYKRYTVQKYTSLLNWFGRLWRP